MYLAARNYPLTTRYSVREMFPRIKHAGYDGLEFCLTNSFQQLRPDTIEAFYRHHVREEAEKNDLKISMVSCHPDSTYDDVLFAFQKRAIPIIRDFGTNLFLIGTNYNYFAGLNQKLRRDDLEYRKKFFERMRELLSIAEGNGVQIVVEPEPSFALLSAAEYFELYDAMGSKNLSYNFDVGHAFLTEADLFDAIRALKGHIVHTHFENLRRGEHWHHLPLDGDIDLQKAVDTLAEIGYDGAICMEVHAYDQLSPQCVVPMQTMLKRSQEK